jgi:hypothetical protein
MQEAWTQRSTEVTSIAQCTKTNENIFAISPLHTLTGSLGAITFAMVAGLTGNRAV